MKRKHANLFLRFAAATAVSMTLAFADSGTWTAIATSGNWDDIANWSSGAGPIADGGAGFTANFTSNITATTTVTMATARSIQTVVFSDNGASGSAWTLSGAVSLTMAGASPKFTNTTNATVNTVVAGSSGFSKDGAQTLTLTGANTYDGVTTVSAGTLNVRHNTALGTVTSGTSVVSGAVLQVQNNPPQSRSLSMAPASAAVARWSTSPEPTH